MHSCMQSIYLYAFVYITWVYYIYSIVYSLTHLYSINDNDKNNNNIHISGDAESAKFQLNCKNPFPYLYLSCVCIMNCYHWEIEKKNFIKRLSTPLRERVRIIRINQWQFCSFKFCFLTSANEQKMHKLI